MASVPFASGGQGRGCGRDGDDLPSRDEDNQAAVSPRHVEIGSHLRAIVIEGFGCRLHIAFPVDHNGWPTRDPEDHPVSELASDRVGALSPFGDLTFPVPASTLPYVHPVTSVNK
jgi:hypothetical protein